MSSNIKLPRFGIEDEQQRIYLHKILNQIGGDTGVVAGTYGDATHALQATVDSTGRITAITAVAITGGGSADPLDITLAAQVFGP